MYYICYTMQELTEIALYIHTKHHGIGMYTFIQHIQWPVLDDGDGMWQHMSANENIKNYMNMFGEAPFIYIRRLIM